MLRNVVISNLTGSDCLIFFLFGSGNYSGTLFLLQNFPLKTCLPKGVSHGCPDCNNCLKVDFHSLQ